MDKITFYDTESGMDAEVYVIEQTVLNGTSYLLACEEEEGDSDAYILKEIRSQGDDVVYEIVSDDTELDAIAGVFEELLEDVEIR